MIANNSVEATMRMAGNLGFDARPSDTVRAVRLDRVGRRLRELLETVAD